jgi:pyruvate/2-oxoglutarate dehydrogenase complex dihydrolipoamide acyltransferase (E2) component
MSTREVVVAEEFWHEVEPGTEALVDNWLVAEGDTVAQDQPLANVVLVKANHEVTAPAAGVVERILVPAQGTFAQGQPLAIMRTA